MRHVRDVLTRETTHAIERAVAEAESTTSAEIVVALAGRSGRYHRAADMFGLTLALLAVAAAWSLWQELAPDAREWHIGSVPVIGLPLVLLMFAAWFVVGAAAATHWPLLARPFMTRAERDGAVRRSGFEAFHTLRVASTRSATGLLIYVSLFERTVWVCPDDAIGAKLGPDAWKPVSDLIAEGFRIGDPGASLVKAARKAGQILATHFPRAADDVNELANRVRVMDNAPDPGV
jgi:putative membrane protein